MAKKLTNEEFVIKLKKINDDIIPLEEYTNSHNKIKCKCLICDNIWGISPNKLLNNRGCPICRKKQSNLKKSLTHDEFISRLKDINRNIRVDGIYVNRNTRIEVTCLTCGNEWFPISGNLIYNCDGCPKCKSENMSGCKHSNWVYRNVYCCDYCGEGIYLRDLELHKTNKHFCGKECYGNWISENIREENHPCWDNNISQDDRIEARKYKEYSSFIKSVMSRDNYNCMNCFKVGGNLEVHHLDGYNWCKEKRVDVNNGITLCKECHRDFHTKYGYGDNTKEQFCEWITVENKISEVLKDG